MAEGKHKEQQKITDKIHKLNENVSSLANMLEVKPMEAVIKFIGKMWGCDQSEMCKTALQVLFMTLNDRCNHDISAILHKILSPHPGKVLEAFIELHGSERKRLQSNNVNAKITDDNVNIPEDVHDLVSIMQDAAKKRQKIKAYSTGYSKLWTDITESDGIVINNCRLNGLLALDCLKDDVDESEYCQFEAGLTISEVQEHLWPTQFRNTKNPERFRVLQYATSGQSLSLAGSVSTGAHGNGLTNGIMADAVVSFQLYCIDKYWHVICYQIEPSNGITDPSKFEDKYKDEENKFELIQDDDTFNACVVNIGCLGVVYCYVLRVVPGFCLEEERRIYKWSEAKPIIRDLYNGNVRDIYSFQLIGSPYAYKLSSKQVEEHRVLICTLKRVNIPATGGRPGGTKLIPLQSLDNALVEAGEIAPHMIPFVTHFSLMYLEHKPIVLNAVEALNTLSGIFGDEVLPYRTCECAMRSDGPETVIQIFEELHKLYNEIRNKEERQLVNVPIAQRFVAKSDKSIAMNYDRKRPSITIEQTILEGTRGADDTLRQFRNQLMDKFDGRPHWGQIHSIDSVTFNELYEETERMKFYRALNFFDPNFVFENKFARRVFGDERRKLLKDTN